MRSRVLSLTATYPDDEPTRSDEYFGRNFKAPFIADLPLYSQPRQLADRKTVGSVVTHVQQQWLWSIHPLQLFRTPHHQQRRRRAAATTGTLDIFNYHSMLIIGGAFSHNWVFASVTRGHLRVRSTWSGRRHTMDIEYRAGGGFRYVINFYFHLHGHILLDFKCQVLVVRATDDTHSVGPGSKRGSGQLKVGVNGHRK